MYFIMYYQDICKILWVGQFSLEVLELFSFLVSQSWNITFFRARCENAVFEGYSGMK